MAQVSNIAILQSTNRTECEVSEDIYSLEDQEKLKAKISSSHSKFREAVKDGCKDYIRDLHVSSKDFVSSKVYSEIWQIYNKYADKFINGNELDPTKIRPSLKLVEPKSTWADLFKVVRHTWSIPYSKGYGRRMRFVVYDEYHDAVIGILGFQSPPADLACRDRIFNYPDDRKMDMINQTMDVYTIGAIPPYSNILGGKLVAGLVCTDDIRRAYWKLYAGKRTLMHNSNIEQPLVAVTTTSVYGRSSIYNRLKFKNRLLAEPIGFTKGFGTIHLEQHYDEIQKLLTSKTGLYISGGYGHGPKIRWQNITRALSLLGLPGSYLEHGLQREVFLFRYVNSLEDGMSGGSFGAPINLSVDDYADFWKERWALPRSERIGNWKEFNSNLFFSEILRKS